MILKLAILLYFCINCFITGYYTCDVFKYGNKNRGTTFKIFQLLLSLLFGALFAASIGTGLILKVICYRIDGFLQLSFFYYYFFTKKWQDLTVKELEFVKKALSKRTTNSIKNRIYKYCANLVFKRNNYHI